VAAAVIGTPTENPRLDREEAAAYCGCSAATLEGYASRGGGGPQYIRAGRKVQYLQSDLDAWLNSRRISCTAER
jgi:predicted DNA-binding transcriptional regulator AlpA